MTESQQLLAEYARNGSEAAFRELVTRYVDLVYSSAVRLLDGDTHRAEDVAQTVFADLARKAVTLSRGVMVGGWLHRHTVYVAANVMRGERRRQLRERQAMEMNALEDHSEANLKQVAPILDEAINELGAEDREAILLRFFEKRDLRSVGEAMGGSENAAQKRVSRALEELRGTLKRRGVALSAAGLGTVLTAEAVTAAPAGLAAGITTTVLAGTAAGGGMAATLLKIMSVTKIQASVAGAIIVASVGTSVVMQQQSQARMREADATWQQQESRLNDLQAENARLAAAPADTGGPAINTEAELQKLRDEAAKLRQQTNQVAMLRESNRRLRASMPKPLATQASLQDQVQQQQLGMARVSFGRQMGLAMILHAEDNKGVYPTNLDQMRQYLGSNAATNGITNVAPENFEIVLQGSRDQVKDPAHTIMLREKDPRQLADGRWQRVYVFADGHTEIIKSVDGNFASWEQWAQQGGKPATRRTP